MRRTALHIVYVTYQIFVAIPILLLATILTALSTIVGCTLGNAHFWSYYPPMIWGRLMCWGMLLPVHVEGRERLDKSTSYVFVANHQGAYDIFLVYGFLGRNFKWLMKSGLRKMPLIGKACESAGHIYVDKSGPKAVKYTCECALHTLEGGMSIVVFPEGARTLDGKMGPFHRGAFQIADELQRAVVPLTIEGPYHILPRKAGITFLHWHPLRLVIHNPIAPSEQGPANVRQTMEKSRQAILSAMK